MGQGILRFHYPACIIALAVASNSIRADDLDSWKPTFSLIHRAYEIAEPELIRANPVCALAAGPSPPFEADSTKLVLSLRTQRPAFRVGDPIRIDLKVQNQSARDFETNWLEWVERRYVLHALKMQADVRLEHIDSSTGRAAKLIDCPSKILNWDLTSNLYFQSGTTVDTFHPIQTLGKEFDDLWPLSPGRYRLSMAVTAIGQSVPSMYGWAPAVSPNFIRGNWSLEADFLVYGEPRTDPKELLFLACECAGVDRYHRNHSDKVLPWVDDRLASFFFPATKYHSSARLAYGHLRPFHYVLLPNTAKQP
jgi:hypothetical protein